MDESVREATPEEVAVWWPGTTVRARWFVDEQWRLAGAVSPLAYRCRGKRGCRNRVVAALQRRHGAGYRWWWYCPDHMYGRIVENGRVLVMRRMEDAP